MTNAIRMVPKEEKEMKHVVLNPKANKVVTIFVPQHRSFAEKDRIAVRKKVAAEGYKTEHTRMFDTYGAKTGDVKSGVYGLMRIFNTITYSDDVVVCKTYGNPKEFSYLEKTIIALALEKGLDVYVFSRNYGLETYDNFVEKYIDV